jgi:uncharacterized membrane protein
MKKHIKWLLTEIDLWIKEGIIAPDQGAALKARYPAPGEGPAWGRIIFFSIGAVLIGLGVILMFAYNWQKMHKFAKLAVIFAALISAHGVGFWLKRPAGRYQVAGEGLHLLGTMLFGAGIWLIAQVYHIDEHYPNALLIWGIGALAMAWALPSMAQGIAAVLLLVLWNSFEAFDFNDPHLISPFLILSAIMPLAWIHRSRVLVTICSMGFLFSLFAATMEIEGDLAALVIFFCACMLVAIGLITQRRTRFIQAGPIFSFLGFCLYMIMIFILSFHQRGSTIWSIDFDQPRQSFLFFAFAAAVVVAWVLAIWPVSGRRQPLKEILQKQYYGVLAAFILIGLSVPDVIDLGGWPAMGIFNLLFLYQAIMMIVNGCRNLNLKLTATGCVLFAVFTFARYTDLFVSLLSRSMAFLIAGAALFSVGIYYSKTKKQTRRETL